MCKCRGGFLGECKCTEQTKNPEINWKKPLRVKGHSPGMKVRVFRLPNVPGDQDVLIVVDEVNFIANKHSGDVYSSMHSKCFTVENAPEEMYVNAYRSPSGQTIAGFNVHGSKEEAQDKRASGRRCIGTFRLVAIS